MYTPQTGSLLPHDGTLHCQDIDCLGFYHKSTFLILPRYHSNVLGEKPSLASKIKLLDGFPFLNFWWFKTCLSILDFFYGQSIDSWHSTWPLNLPQSCISQYFRLPGFGGSLAPPFFLIGFYENKIEYILGSWGSRYMPLWNIAKWKVGQTNSSLWLSYNWKGELFVVL